MSTGNDYDALRPQIDSDSNDQYVTGFVTRRKDPSTGIIDIDDTEPCLAADSVFAAFFEADDSAPLVSAQRPDEFTCSRCFLVVHSSRHAPNNDLLCRDCS